MNTEINILSRIKIFFVEYQNNNQLSKFTIVTNNQYFGSRSVRLDPQIFQLRIRSQTLILELPRHKVAKRFMKNCQKI